MQLWQVVLVIGLNLGISTFNAWAVGASWAKSCSWWEKVVYGSAFVMAGCGFSSAYSFIFGGLAYQFNYLSLEAWQAMMQLVYVLIILPVIGTGMVITLDSIMTTYRTRSAANAGISIWNVYAQTRNTVDAFRSLGPVLDSLGSFFSSSGDSDDEEDSGVVVLLAIVAILSGFLTAFWISSQSYEKTAGMIQRKAV